LRSWIPIDETVTGQLHYKVMMSTLDGSNMIEYPQWGGYLTLDLHYRAAFGSLLGSLFLFTTVAFFVWGGLAVCLRMMMEDKEDVAAILIAELDEEGSA
jgi:hypothetical protein